MAGNGREVIAVDKVCVKCGRSPPEVKLVPIVDERKVSGYECVPCLKEEMGR